MASFLEFLPETPLLSGTLPLTNRPLAKPKVAGSLFFVGAILITWLYSWSGGLEQVWKQRVGLVWLDFCVTHSRVMHQYVKDSTAENWEKKETVLQSKSTSASWPSDSFSAPINIIISLLCDFKHNWTIICRVSLIHMTAQRLAFQSVTKNSWQSLQTLCWIVFLYVSS